MQTFNSAKSLSNYLVNCRKKGLKIGFVPTMGALHSGHISLIKLALTQNEVVVSSIFVNPTQFNDPGDFDRYPRQLEQDSKLLEEANCTALFHPQVSEVYPSPDLHDYDLGAVSKRLEGEFRPGHFNGVASVVKRLLEMVNPDRAYFGQKDFQQLLVIKRMVKAYALPVQVIGCATVRDEHGLALSSRNQLLRQEDRVTARALYQSLKLVKDAFSNGQTKGLEHLGRTFLKQQPGLKLEYFDIADASTLEHIGDNAIAEDQNPVALIAAGVNGVRLIDNEMLRPQSP